MNKVHELSEQTFSELHIDDRYIETENRVNRIILRVRGNLDRNGQ